MSESSFFSRNGLQRSDFCLQNVETRQFEKDEEKLDLRFFLRKVWIFGRNRVSPLGHKLFFHDFNIRNMKNGNQNIRLSCPNNVSFHSEFMKKNCREAYKK